MTSDQVFIGVGLTLALAVGSQLVGQWLRVPARNTLLSVSLRRHARRVVIRLLALGVR